MKFAVGHTVLDQDARMNLDRQLPQNYAFLSTPRRALGVITS
jgi:hypothetical protein